MGRPIVEPTAQLGKTRVQTARTVEVQRVQNKVVAAQGEQNIAAAVAGQQALELEAHTVAGVAVGHTVRTAVAAHTHIAEVAGRTVGVARTAEVGHIVVHGSFGTSTLIARPAPSINDRKA